MAISEKVTATISISSAMTPAALKAAWTRGGTARPDKPSMARNMSLKPSRPGIGSRLKIKQIQQEKEELLRSLQLYYRVFFMGEDLDL